MSSTFLKYLKAKAEDDTPEGDFARDALEDRRFPKRNNYAIIRGYLRRRNAYIGCMKAFERCWVDYDYMSKIKEGSFDRAYKEQQKRIPNLKYIKFESLDIQTPFLKLAGMICKYLKDNEIEERVWAAIGETEDPREWSHVEIIEITNGVLCICEEKYEGSDPDDYELILIGMGIYRGPNVVYRYVDKNDRYTKYIGITSNLSARVSQHKNDALANGQWDIWYCDGLSRTEAEMFESHFIYLFGTREYYNRAKVDQGLSRYMPEDVMWKPLIEGQLMQMAEDPGVAMY